MHVSEMKILHVHTLVVIMVTCCYDNLLFPASCFVMCLSVLGMLTQSVLNQLSSHEQPWMPSIVNQCDIGENFEIVNGSSIPQNLRFIITEVTIPANASSDQVTSDTDVVIIFMKKKTSCKYYYFIILKMYIYNKSFLKIWCNHFITL